MNANELADELDGFLKEQEQLPWGTKQVYLDQAATMIRQQQAEIAELKHMNKNWSISEGLALQEIELMKHFLQANQLYLSFEEWKHSDSARAILRKAQEK